MGELLVHPHRKVKEMSEENVFPNGVLVEVINTAVLDDSGDRAYRGTKFIVDDYAPFNEDPDFYSEVYMGYDSQGNYVVAAKDNVKLVLSAEAARNRKLPDTKTVLKEFDFLGGFSDFNFDESDIVEDDTIEVYGETPEGLPFGVRLKVTDIFHIDR